MPKKIHLWLNSETPETTHHILGKGKEARFHKQQQKNKFSNIAKIFK